MQEHLINIQSNERVIDKYTGITVGSLVGIKETGEPLVNFSTNGSIVSLLARSTLRIDQNDIGRKITIMFENGDCQKPIVTGLIQEPEVKKIPDNGHPDEKPIPVKIDGERLQLTAKKEIVLRCGKGSITITKSGKILIRGTYLLNRSSGANRIKGGSIQLN
jgi:hypothetical protein